MSVTDVVNMTEPQLLREMHRLLEEARPKDSWYEWRVYRALGKRDEIRPYCVGCDMWTTWTVKVDDRYNRASSRHAPSVQYKGRMVQAWECRNCVNWIVK